MTGFWMRRAFMAAACAAAALLAGCGSSSTVSALSPARFIVFGDAFNDLGAGGLGKYTVNDGSTNNWILQVATQYGRAGLASSVVDGGQGYARGNARVTSAIDAAGGTAPSISQQITTFLATNTLGPNDFVIINAGISDIVAQAQARRAGTQTDADVVANAGVAATEYAAQVRRLLGAGAKYVAMVGTYDLGRSPYATAAGMATVLSQASSKFNNELLLATVDLGDRVLYIDAALYYNLVTSTPGNYGFNNGSGYVCTSVDPGPGNGTGLGQVNSSLCNAATVGGVDYSKYVFADALYATPQMQRLFGEYAYTRIKARF